MSWNQGGHSWYFMTSLAPNWNQVHQDGYHYDLWVDVVCFPKDKVDMNSHYIHGGQKNCNDLVYTEVRKSFKYKNLLEDIKEPRQTPERIWDTMSEIKKEQFRALPSRWVSSSSSDHTDPSSKPSWLGFLEQFFIPFNQSKNVQLNIQQGKGNSKIYWTYVLFQKEL